MRFLNLLLCALPLFNLTAEAGYRRIISPSANEGDASQLLSAHLSIHLESAFRSGDGSQFWVVGDTGTILHYSKATRQWEPQSVAEETNLYSGFANIDGSQLWAVGEKGFIGYHSSEMGYFWDIQSREDDDKNDLESVFGSSDGSQVWAVGDRGTILHYSEATREWKAEKSGTVNHLRSVFATSDGSQLWAVGWKGTILSYSKQN
ncbi:MAG: hypothetical protein WA734_21075, partial [Candidatus Acidiferrales bacterium]